MSPSILKRIRPPTSSSIERLATSFKLSGAVSGTLLQLFQGLRDLAAFFEFNARDNPGLGADEIMLFHRQTHEIEYNLLDYPYRTSSMVERQTGSELHPVEGLARVAGLCYIAFNITICPPASGLGRALTVHLTEAIKRLEQADPNSKAHAIYALVTWTCFMGAQGSHGQPRRRFFIDRLANMAIVQEWSTWEEASELFEGYLYVPRLHESTWKEIWIEATKRA